MGKRAKKMVDKKSEKTSPLGKSTTYSNQYAPELLYPVPRLSGRQQLGIAGKLPFDGDDLWTAYELSWLNPKGKPQVAIARFLVPCTSPHMIESKSFKLYLNSLSQTQFASEQELSDILKKDLSKVAGESVKVRLFGIESRPEAVTTINYESLDKLDIAVSDYSLNPGLLKVKQGRDVSEKLVSHLFKSNCPVTGQPDWASLYIDYSGHQIQHEALLRYIVSYRSCAEFHEQCVERVFMDILQKCRPQTLTVQARFLRRGGLDINPVRSTFTAYKHVPRTTRQ